MNANQITPRSRWLRFVLLAAVALALLAGGCASVRVPEPIGDKPHPLVTADWEGTWIGGRDLAQVRVTDAAAGKLEIAYLEHSGFPGNGGPNLKKFCLLVRESGDWLFANLAESEGKADHYEWARVKLANDHLVAWGPDVEKFRVLVQQGKLKGVLADQDVNLAPLSTSDLEALRSGALGVPFLWDEPLVFRRVAR